MLQGLTVAMNLCCGGLLSMLTHKVSAIRICVAAAVLQAACMNSCCSCVSGAVLQLCFRGCVAVVLQAAYNYEFVLQGCCVAGSLYEFVLQGCCVAGMLQLLRYRGCVSVGLLIHQVLVHVVAEWVMEGALRFLVAVAAERQVRAGNGLGLSEEVQELLVHFEAGWFMSVRSLF